jgi:23S rRNA-/tRNA-specific pseudouridylate synthase
MARHRDRPLPKEDSEARWTDAIERLLGDLDDDDDDDKPHRILQIVGLDSPTRTAFARVVLVMADHQDADQVPHVTTSRTSTITLRQLVDKVVEEYHVMYKHECQREALQVPVQVPVPSSTAEELLRLGSVWILDPSTVDRPQNRPKWKRWICSSSTSSSSSSIGTTEPIVWNQAVLLRIHCRPARYTISCDDWNWNWKHHHHPLTKSIIVLDEHAEIGVCVLNKPGGVPSHATVDNGVENALTQFQWHHHQQQQQQQQQHRSDGDLILLPCYASLPQRLDTETSGLLLIATTPKFASYCSKLLQQKTESHTTTKKGGHKMLSSSPTTTTTTTTTTRTIEKKYRCLVCFEQLQTWTELKRLEASKSVVTHHLDAHSPAPKRFLSKIPNNDDEQEQEQEHEPNNEDDDDSQNKPKESWLECQLRIQRVSEAIPVSSSSKNQPALASRLWNNNNNKAGAILLPSGKPNAAKFVAELEIELLTGRTHQIRGQLAALDCPIVGDPLYGGSQCPVVNVTTNERMTHRMALQCCWMQFPKPNTETWTPSDTQLSVSLDRAWWTECLEDFGTR